MKASELFYFREIFEKEKAAILKDRLTLEEPFEIRKDELSDEVDAVAEERESSLRIRMKQREALYLRKIDDALARIRGGTFGVCHCCGDDIDFRRLQARPTTDQCIGCKENEERKESGFNEGQRHHLGRTLRLA